MAYKSIRMDTINQLRQFHHEGKSIKRIAKLLGLSRNTVRSYLRKINECGLDTSKEFSTEQLSELYNEKTIRTSQRRKELEAHFESICQKLSRTGVTREQVWAHYIMEHPDGYSYRSFCRLLKQYLKRNNVTLAIKHLPGAVMQVDFAGKKMSYFDRHTGKEHKAEVLVCTLPCSGMTFAMALPSQQQEHFIAGLNAALLYFGGVPESMLSDNLKSYVIKPDRYSPKFTELCLQLSAHYGMDLSATRVARPKDKGHVERHVTIVYQNVYAHMHDDQHHSIDELNKVIIKHIDALNLKARDQGRGSRREEFDEVEGKSLQTLPAQMFVIKKSTRAKVQRNYHVILGEDSHQYSVPYQHVGKITEVIYTPTTVEVYLGNIRIAVHSRDRRPHAFTTLDQHRPEKHQKYLEQSQYTNDDLLQQAERIGPNTHWAVQYIIDHQSGLAQAHKASVATLQLAKLFSSERLEKACLRIRPANTVTYTIVKNILVNHTEQAEHMSDYSPIPRMHDNVRGAAHYF